MKTLWFGFVAAGCALINHTDAFAQDKIRVGLSSVSALHGAMWVAEQKGLFRKHGIETEIIVTGQGGYGWYRRAARQRYPDRQCRREILW